MNGTTKITRSHRDRVALIYVRQSTLAQVREHTESTARQYDLTRTATELGWPAARVAAIDADLGLSGRSAAGRGGLKEVVARVCLGEIGAILAHRPGSAVHPTATATPRTDRARRSH